MCLKEKKQYDLKYGIWEEELVIGSIVLLYNTKRENDISQKLSYKWLRPYKICDMVKNKGIYIFEKFDRLWLAGTFAGDRLKKFHPRQWLQLDYAPNLNNQKILTLNDILASDSNNELSDRSDNFGFWHTPHSAFSFFLFLYGYLFCLLFVF